MPWIDLNFINQLVPIVIEKLHLKEKTAAREYNIDKQIVRVLNDNEILMSTTDQNNEFVFGDYSEALKKAVCDFLKDNEYEITTIEKEGAISDARTKSIYRDRRQTKLF